jgi:curved DNA-binding protein CbpA
MSDRLPPSLYLILGFSKDPTASAIKQRYRQLFLKYHPDRSHEESPEAALERFRQMRTAYEILGDGKKRSRYDAQVIISALSKERPDTSWKAKALEGVESRPRP